MIEALNETMGFSMLQSQELSLKWALIQGSLHAAMVEALHYYLFMYLSSSFLMLKMQLHMIIFSIWLALIERFRKTKQLTEIMSHPLLKR